MRTYAPDTFEDAAAALAAAAAAGDAVQIRGAGTKLAWGTAQPQAQTELCTTSLNQVLEHNVGDLTAVVQAGVPFARLREQLAGEGQMLAIDPPLGHPDEEATVGGVIATADSGPLRHRYGAPRDLVLGITVALSDGTIARAGSKVIKNVAGYDLAKLFTGSFGTLGMILSASVRLHPLPLATATALGTSSTPSELAEAVRALSSAPLELEALDVAWRGGRGGILARCGGTQSARRAQRVADLMRRLGLEYVDVAEPDEALWDRQRAGQRSAQLALVKLSSRPSRLAELLHVVDAAGGTLVSRAGLGTSYVEVDPEAVSRLRGGLRPGEYSVVLDAPAEARAGLDAWGPNDPVALGLMQRVKHRFDPALACNPGAFVGGI
ncbi:MAG: FAD-binding oxidoreductase [Solirubrobacteraceae bacterium]